MLDSTLTRSSGGVALLKCPILERAPRTRAMADHKSEKQLLLTGEQ